MKAKSNKQPEPHELKTSHSPSFSGIQDGDSEHGILYFRGPQYGSTPATETEFVSGEADRQLDAISSSCGDRKGRDTEATRPLRLQCSDCEELLHTLSNVITAVLMNAQVLEWKLPPYSHLKRPIREIERNTQRGSELVKQLMRRLGSSEVRNAAGVSLEKAKTGIAGRSGDLSQDQAGTTGAAPHKHL